MLEGFIMDGSFLPNGQVRSLLKNLRCFLILSTQGRRFDLEFELRNEGHSLKGDIRINDRDQMVVELRDTFLPSGYSEYYFPYTRYFFQRSDHCFTVFVEYERFPHKANSTREFCARPLGWTLRP